MMKSLNEWLLIESITNEITDEQIEQLKDIFKKYDIPEYRIRKRKGVGGDWLMDLDFSMDKRDDWANGIYQNSRYVTILLFSDNDISINQSYKLPRLRKSRPKDFNGLKKIIEKYLQTLTT